MFVVVLFIPVVAGNVFAESSSRRVPEIMERSALWKTYTIFDPCNLKQSGKRTVSCAQLKREGNHESGYYSIAPYNQFLVWCDMDTDGGGWTTIQRRSKNAKGEGSFEKSLEEYETGFYGDPSSYWIGNDNLHALTSHPDKAQVLRIELTKENEQTIIVRYGKFTVGSKYDGYVLTCGDYSSPNGKYWHFHHASRIAYRAALVALCWNL
ncbi:ixoderin B, putative [Ixodes scapularis]|uniref:Ixoderin B, putative n=2 Tax=Ixodes scapularis TaxID=6945 RepID=B7QJJ5_IXOSC|nr:ixoderin B, putative [Ixodes scapularis]|eukprot:XP_002415352.1 ixoderin B, putative [Ixodes scapularis]